MTMTGLKTLKNAQPSAPRLWFQRFAILRHPVFVKENIIRDFPLERGLNIILGRSDENISLTERPDFSASGHSVGKSSFCRLLRYLLTEPEVGSSRHRNQLLRRLPEAWVAAEVMINGCKWAIARPLNSGRQQRIGRDIDIETLFASDFSGLNKKEYEQVLSSLLPPGLNLPDRQFTWLDLLAWLTRDQNARLRSFWAWREPSQENAPKANGIFSKPTMHPRHMVMGMLKMLPFESEQLRKELHDITKKQDQLDAEVAKWEVWPKTQLNFAREDLKRHLSITNEEDKLEDSEESLLGPINIANNLLANLDGPDGTIASLQIKLQKAEDESTWRYQYKRKLYDEYLAPVSVAKAANDEQEAALGNTESLSSEQPSDLELLNGEITKIENRLNTPCENMSKFKIGECRFVLERLESLKKERERAITFFSPTETRQQPQPTPEQQQQLPVARMLAAQYEQRRVEYLNAESLYKKAEAERIRLRDEIEQIKHKAEAIKEDLANIEKYKKYLKGELTIPEYTEALTSQQENQEAIAQKESALSNANVKAARQSADLQKLFSELVSTVFGSQYAGKILSKNELDFHILNNGELSGAVTDTLAIILGDLTAMLAAGLDASHHPGFHIHDSPREADLSPALYRWLFKIFADLTIQLGGPDKAPFQYIVTTTTPPPQELRPYICLELAAKDPKDYLFGECLHSEEALLL